MKGFEASLIGRTVSSWPSPPIVSMFSTPTMPRTFPNSHRMGERSATVWELSWPRSRLLRRRAIAPHRLSPRPDQWREHAESLRVRYELGLIRLGDPARGARVYLSLQSPHHLSRLLKQESRLRPRTQELH